MADRLYTIKDIVDAERVKADIDHEDDVAAATTEQYTRMAVAADVYDVAVVRGLTIEGWLVVRQAYEHWLRWQSALNEVRAQEGL